MNTPTDVKARVSDYEKRRRQRVMKEQLRRLTDAVLVYVAGMDAMVAARKDVPDDIGRWLAQNVHALEFTNDAARYHGLGINFRTDDKERAVAQAAKRIREGK